MAAFSSADQLGRRPAPVNTSMRRARSGLGVSSEIDMGRSSKSAPNVTPHAWLRKALPRRRLRTKPQLDAEGDRIFAGLDGVGHIAREMSQAGLLLLGMPPVERSSDPTAIR